LRVKLDLEACRGHGVCAVEAPQVFDLDPRAKRAVVLQDAPGDELRDAVARAVRHCPTFALRLEDGSR
jgi:sterol 14-demethylase